MLRSIIDFTMTDSFCTIFYLDRFDHMKFRRYEKTSKEGFYVNGNINSNSNSVSY